MPVIDNQKIASAFDRTAMNLESSAVVQPWDLPSIYASCTCVTARFQ